MSAENTMILQEIFKAQEEREELLRFRNPSASFWYNWFVALVVVALFGSFFWWGMDIQTRHKAEAMTAELLAEMDAENEYMLQAAEAEAAERQAQNERQQISEAQAVARAFFGIRNFVTKYGYDNSDMETYARCMFNRADARGKSLEEIVAEKDQFIAYSDNNTLVKEYYDLALQFVAEWHAEDAHPCDVQKFQNAVLTEYGIYLVDDIRKPVPEKWHA